MDNPKFIVSNKMAESISMQWVKPSLVDMYSLCIFSLFSGLDFYIGLPPEKFDRGTKLTLYDEKISMAELFKGLMERSNEKYHKRSMAHKSPTDLMNVCHYITNSNTPRL